MVFRELNYLQSDNSMLPTIKVCDFYHYLTLSGKQKSRVSSPQCAPLMRISYSQGQRWQPEGELCVVTVQIMSANKK